MKQLRVDELTELEEIEYAEAQALVHGTTILKIRDFTEKGYVPPDIAQRLTYEHEAEFKKACEKIQKSGGEERAVNLAERALRLYLIGMEKQALKTLFTFDEVTERIFKHILGKLTIQSEEAERGNLNPDASKEYDKRDVFENMSEFARSLFTKDSAEEVARNHYLYYRAEIVIAHKALKELGRIEREYTNPVFTADMIARARALYDGYRKQAIEKSFDLAKKEPDLVKILDEALASRSVFRVEEKVLEDLRQRELITPKLYIKLREEYETDVLNKTISKRDDSKINSEKN
jgi:hypothetical protein